MAQAAPGAPWQNWLPKLWGQGLSGNQALSFLKAEGISPRRQTFFNEWRSVAGYEKGQYNARFQPESKAPDAAYITPSERYVHERYTYRFEADLFDVSTGEYGRGFLHFGSWDLLTLGEVRDELTEAIATRRGERCESAILGAFVGAYQRVWTPPIS